MNSIAWIRGSFQSENEAQNYRGLPNLDMIDVPEERGMKLRVFGMDRKISNFYEHIRGYEILHTVELYNTMSYQASQAGRKLVITHWETIPTIRAFTYPFKRKRLPEVINHTNIVHCPSNAAKSCAIALNVPEEKIRVIPYGVDMKLFISDDNQWKMFFAEDKPDVVVGMLGRQVTEKGNELLVDIQKALGNFTLLLVGKPVRGWRRAGVKEVFCGRYDLMPIFHNLVDIFAMPSTSTDHWEEQFGFSMLEAMACGKPVVAYDSGAIGEHMINKKHGMLIKDGDTKAFQDAITYLIDNPNECIKMGNAARMHVFKNFNLEDVRKKLVNMYGELT
jgi:glycosyltransferase involved in cell wall biosynthesis